MCCLLAFSVPFFACTYILDPNNLIRSNIVEFQGIKKNETIHLGLLLSKLLLIML